MSHYTKVKTKLKDKASLLKALEDMGFTKEMIRVHDTPHQVEGYEGRLREERAEIIIPRRYVGGSSNDIGFKLQEDGSWGAIISEFDTSSGQSQKNERTKGMRGYGEMWLKALHQRYAYHHLKTQIAEQGYYIESEVEKDGQIYIECGSSF
jgi:hypothetical protein